MDSLNLPMHLAQFADWEYGTIADGEKIQVNKCGSISLKTGASGETNTLADPSRAGLWLDITLYSDGGGDRVIATASPVNQAGNNRLTFGDVGDTIFLKSVRYSATEFRWRVVAYDGVALSTV